MQPRERRNVLLNIAGEGAWGVHISLIAPATVLTVMLTEYGASKNMIGLLGAFDQGAPLLMQLFGLYVFTSRAHQKRDLILWHLALLTPWLFLAAGVCCLFGDSPVLMRWTVFIAFAALRMGIGVVLASWTDWLASIFPLRIRGFALGSAMAVSALLGTGGALATGWILTRWSGPQTYGGLFTASGVLTILSMVFFFYVIDPESNRRAPRLRPSPRALAAHFAHSLREKNFRNYLTGRVLSISGFSVIPFLTVYYTSPAGGGLEKGTVVAFGAAMTVGNALANVAVGFLGDRRGHRAGVLLGIVAQTVALVVALATRGPWSCLVAYAGAGAYMATTWVSHFNMLFETCPHEHRTAHITLANLIIGVAGILAPIAAGLMAEAWGVKPLFAASLVLSLVALAWVLCKVEEPRRRVPDEDIP